MLRIIQNSAILAVAIFALMVAGFALWRSFQQPNSTTYNNQSTQEDSHKSSDVAPNLGAEGPEQAIARYNFWLMLFTAVLAAATIALGISTTMLWLDAKSASERQLRAWVSPEILAWRGISDGKPLAVQIGLKDNGQTPTTVTLIEGGIRILPFPLSKTSNFPSPVVIQETAVNLFPGNAAPVGWATAEAPFSNEEIAEITSDKGKVRAYFFMHIQYRDIFGKLRNTHHCAVMEPTSVTRDKNGQILTWVWSPYPPQLNSFD